MLDNLGFHKPTYAELLASQEARAKELFGNDIDTSETTILGKYIRLNVYDYATIYEIAEMVYYARFPNEATGQSLDRLCPFANISRNPATAARHKVEFFGTANTVVAAGDLVGTGSGVTFRLLESVTLSDDGFGTGTAQGVVECTELGLIGNVPVGTIDRMINPNAYVQSVTHIALELLAKDTETDVALRERFAQTIKGSGAGTFSAVYGALSRIPNVDGVVIVENDTSETVDGRPPHTFQCYIVAPESTDNEVAQTIFDKKPIGIKPLGEVAVDVMDEGGFTHTMRFSRAIEVRIALSAQIRISNLFPDNGVEQLKTVIANYVNGLSNGDDVIVNRFYSLLYSIDGVEDVPELLIGKVGEALAHSNIACLPAEFARITKDNIAIEVADYVDQ